MRPIGRMPSVSANRASGETYRSQKMHRVSAPLPDAPNVQNTSYVMMRIWESFYHMPRHGPYTKQPSRSHYSRPTPYAWRR